MAAAEMLQNFVDNYGIGWSKEKVVERAYREFANRDCYIINDRYLHLEGGDYQLIKSRKENRWIVREF